MLFDRYMYLYYASIRETNTNDMWLVTVRGHHPNIGKWVCDGLP